MSDTNRPNSYSKWLKLSASAIAVACLGVAGASAQAATDTDDDVAYQNTVVVIGNKETRLLDASVPVTTVDSETLLEQAPRNIADALINIPSLQIENTSGNTNNEYRFRGVGAGGTQFLELEEDGIPIMRDGPDFLYRVHNGIDSIEVVRGGNSPILRTAAIGAVIDFRYKEGDRDQQEGDIYLQASDFGMRRVEGWLGGPLTDNLTYSLSGYYTTDEGVRQVDFAANEGYNLHGSLKYHFSDDSGYLKVSGRKFDEGNIVYLAVPLLGDPNNPSPFPGGPDITTGSLLSSEIALSTTFSAPGEPSRLDLRDGNASKMNYVGTEFVKEWDLDNGLNVEFISRNRYTDVTSRFSGYYAAGFAIGGDFQTGESLVPNLLNSNTMGAGLVNYAYALPAGFDPTGYTVTNQQGDVLDMGTITDANINGIIEAGEVASTSTTLANGNGIFMPVAAFDQDNPFTSFQQDLELNFDWQTGDISHYASLGYYYLKMDREQVNRQQLFLIDLKPQASRIDVNLQDAGGAQVTLTDDGFLTHNHWLNGDAINTKVDSFYGTYELGWDRLTLDIGLRHDRFEDKRVFAQTQNVFGDGPNQIPLPAPGTTVSPAVTAIQQFTGSFLTDFDFENEELNWTVGGAYEVSDTIGAYARATEAYLPNRNGATASNIFELGGRYANGPIYLAANLFSLTQEGDVQERGLTINGQQVLAQFQTDRESTGIELEGDVSVTDNLGIFFSATYQDPKFASGGSATATGGSGVTQAELDAAVGDLTAIDGNQIGNQPQSLGTFGVRYDFDIGTLGTLNLNGVVRHVGEVPLDDGNNTFIDGYNQVNLGAVFESYEGDWYARVNMQNVTDEEAVQRVFGGPQSITDQLVAADGFYGRPLLGRNIVFGVGYRF